MAEPMATAEWQKPAPAERSFYAGCLGEANFNTLKTLDCKEVAMVKPFVFKFES
jgi:hypothetical protein